MSERLKTVDNSGIFTATENLSWKKQRVHRKEAIKSMHYIGTYLRNRNYSLVHDTYEKRDLHIPYLRPKEYSQAMETQPTTPNRNLDPTEDLFRRMSYGQVSKAMYDRSKEFLKFYVDCGKFFQKFIFWSGMVVTFASVIGWLLVTSILLVSLKKMKSFWRDVLSVQVSHLFSSGF